MDLGIEQALISLIPAINGRPPTELVQLATSLLAQSRTRASSLKADEEIARIYACANLACERLKHSLMLPKIDPKPPCPPRVYRKLYQYLDTQLPANPRKRPRTSQSNDTKSPVTVPDTPTKRNTTTSGRSSKSKAPIKPKPTTQSNVQAQVAAQTQTQGQEQEEVQVSAPAPALPLESVPEWVEPAVKVLCADIFKSAAVPHVLAGIECVLTVPAPFLPNHPRAPEKGKEDKLPAVVIAISCFVNTRMSGDKMDGKMYPGRRNQAVQMMNDFKDRYENWEEITPYDVDDWMLEIGSRGWLRFEWLRRIKIGCAGQAAQQLAATNAGDGDDESEQDGRDSDEEGAAVQSGAKRPRLSMRDSRAGGHRKDTLQCGLGTMMQDKVDYLSDEKRDEFQQFKARIYAWAAEIAATRRRSTARHNVE